MEAWNIYPWIACVVVLAVLYFCLLYFTKFRGVSFRNGLKNSGLEQVKEVEVIPLSSKTRLFILRRDGKKIFVAESEVNVEVSVEEDRSPAGESV
jgi:hypothetical protein